MTTAKSQILDICLTAITAVGVALVMPRCGSSNSGGAPTPATTPAPSLAPTPPATVESAYFASYPSNPPLGYLAGETILFDVRFTSDIAVSGYPKLRVEIGDRAGYAIVDTVFSGGGYGDVRFAYRVLYDDHDADGISIAEDAIELNDGQIFTYDDERDVDPNLGRHAVENHRGHTVRKTTPMPDIRYVPFGTPGVRMAWGSTIAPWLSGSKVHYFPPKDIEVLKCIFPKR